jgi:capsular exopolysaccharide synthesis family protein
MNTENTESVQLLEYWQILYARKEIVIAVALLMILTGIVITRAMPRVYSASALIQVQREQPDINPYGQSFVRYDPYFLRTQFEIIRSVPIMEEVIRELNLNEELGRAYGYWERLSAAASFDRTVNLVRSKMVLDIHRDTDLISITMKFDKPDKPDGEAANAAARTANMVARVFRTWTLRQTRELKEGGLEVLQQELDDQNRKIAAEEQKIYELRQKFGLTLMGEGDMGSETIRSEISMLATRQSQAALDTNVRRMRYEQIVAMPTKDVAGALRVLTGDSSLEPLLTQKQEMEIQLNAMTRAALGHAHPDVVRARATLDEVDAKIDERVNTVKYALRLDFERAQAELDELTTKLEAVKVHELELSASGVMDYRNATAELGSMKARRDFLEDRLIREKMMLRIPSTSVQIIQPAKVVGTPVPISPNFALNIMLSVVAGIFFGVVLAFFVEYLDTSIKTVDDIEKHLGTAVLGIIPQKVRHLNDPTARPTHSEPYRVMRTNLKSSKKLNDGKVICVTSASAGEGKTQTLFNLAYVCAEVGDKVILVDSDLHRPRQHKILQTDNTPGLCNVIVGEAMLDEAIRHTAHANLDFLPSGRMAGASVHGLIDTEEMAKILEELRSRYDRVLLDSPPMVGVSDASQLVRMVDGVVMVVQHRKYPRALAKRAKDMIVNMGGNLLGVVLNNINVARDYSSYYYKHQYYYYYPYSYTSSKKS